MCYNYWFSTENKGYANAPQCCVHQLSWRPTSLFASHVGPHLTSEHQNLQKECLTSYWTDRMGDHFFLYLPFSGATQNKNTRETTILALPFRNRNATEWLVRSSKPLGSVTFFTHQVPPSVQCIEYRISFLGVEQQGCVVDHPAFSAEILCG